ncbi:MAG: putative Primosomal protein [Nitrospira sp.]|jgi:primosomal protein N' (replication factor Y)|nr:putative Primosomal protein [Nitrospira sp.]
MFDQPVSVSLPRSGPDFATYVDVLLPRRLHRPFTYVIPAELKGMVVMGQHVIVPFGSHELHGIVIAVHAQLPPGAPQQGLKKIRSLTGWAPDHYLSSNQIDLSRWVAGRYAAPWGQCIRLVVPPIEPAGRVQARYVMTEQGLACQSSWEECGAVESELLKRLRRHPKGIMAATLQKGDAPRVILGLRTLLRKGLILRRDDAVSSKAPRTRGKKPDAPQQASPSELSFDFAPVPPEAASWKATVNDALSKEAFISLLLQGFRDTRLWCLVQAVQDTVRRGRRVLIVTGDMENASRLVAAMAKVGEGSLLMHSGLSARDRATVWESVQNGSVMILIGTRMAVFAPISRLGLVWVEGEDDTSLKEEQVPRYHAREVAWRRAACDRALLVLASSHPSLESWSAVQRGKMTFCAYRDEAVVPSVKMIDMKERSNEGAPKTVLSSSICKGLREALQQNVLAILYVNRKGFASVLHCRDCGRTPQCDTCSVALTFYRLNNHVRCHYCGRTKTVPDRCDRCQSFKLEPVGSGTEHIEGAVRQVFPQARVARVDGETIRRPADAHVFHRQLAAGDIDIVIGTQMLFRLGLQRQAGFVGVPDADAGLHVPDFRSSERTFHGLSDAAELARPAHAGGIVMVQTSFMDHHAMIAIARGDDSVFFEQEQSFRKMLQYPPFTHLVRLDVSGTLEPAVARAADRWATLLRAEVTGRKGQESMLNRDSSVLLESSDVGARAKGLVILGPSPAPRAMARGRYYWQILVKCVLLEAGTEIVVRTLGILERESRQGALRFDIDVDPVSMV